MVKQWHKNSSTVVVGKDNSTNKSQKAVAIGHQKVAKNSHKIMLNVWMTMMAYIEYIEYI